MWQKIFFSCCILMVDNLTFFKNTGVRKVYFWGEENPHRRAGWCAPDLGVPGGSGADLRQDPGSKASSLSGEMRSEQGPMHGQTHGPALWTGRYPQRLGSKRKGEKKTEKERWADKKLCSSNIQPYLSFLVGGDRDGGGAISDLA